MSSDWMRVATISYTRLDDDVVREWRVSATTDDDEASMRARLARHRPTSTFVGVTFEADSIRAKSERVANVTSNLGEPLALVSEIADAMLGPLRKAPPHPTRCVPTIDLTASSLTITVVVPIDDASRREVFGLADRLTRAVGIAQLRGLAAHFDIDPAQIEALLPKLED